VQGIANTLGYGDLALAGQCRCHGDLRLKCYLTLRW
jgi:hypothetical protein